MATNGPLPRLSSWERWTVRLLPVLVTALVAAGYVDRYWFMRGYSNAEARLETVRRDVSRLERRVSYERERLTRLRLTQSALRKDVQWLRSRVALLTSWQIADLEAEKARQERLRKRK